MNNTLPIAFARCFSGRDGEVVLDHLKAITLRRAMGPDSSDAILRHMEGQRQLVAYILGLVARGRDNPSIHVTSAEGEDA